MNPVRCLRGGPDRAARGSGRRLPGDPGDPRHHHRPGLAARRRLGRRARRDRRGRGGQSARRRLRHAPGFARRALRGPAPVAPTDRTVPRRRERHGGPPGQEDAAMAQHHLRVPRGMGAPGGGRTDRMGHHLRSAPGPAGRARDQSARLRLRPGHHERLQEQDRYDQRLLQGTAEHSVHPQRSPVVQGVHRRHAQFRGVLRLRRPGGLRRLRLRGPRAGNRRPRAWT